ncbi:MAG TPA: bifunctional adenosylcobinamide kinase/adenosylcobinamide-phosphate guanylyltransferase [Planctomycetota bacterium]|nr:bifunctional adenosylcobinamide kinase/adenosylcobinamide-phosphate guanylyltransferase [Planctomycetota bacterium]
MIVLVGGGARSGKSAFALRRARELGRRRVFLATAEAGDAEMADRIARHAKERGREFRILEVPIRVVEALRTLDPVDVVLLDCLTLWISNMLMAGLREAAILRECSRLAALLRKTRCHVVVVTNEVGLGLVPETPLGRTFRDVAGRAHQTLARLADEVYFGALGVLIRLKPDLGVVS